VHEVPRCTVGPSRLFVHRTILILKILGFSQIETRVTTVIGTCRDEKNRAPTKAGRQEAGKDVLRLLYDRVEA
jgi:hypothetical protein